jgi:hypothetical protein
MKTSKRITLALLLVLAYAAMLPTLSVADTWNPATKSTFSEPVEVPGMVLPSGTYWFTDVQPSQALTTLSYVARIDYAYQHPLN